MMVVNRTLVVSQFEPEQEETEETEKEIPLCFLCFLLFEFLRK
jgi:hypothetical protein